VGGKALDYSHTVVVLDYHHLNGYAANTCLVDAILRVQIQGAVGVVVIIADNIIEDESRRNALSLSLSTEISIPIMHIRASDAGALKLSGAKLTAFPGP